MRRMNGRSPNFVFVGLVLILILVVYKCWTLSSQNDDLRKEIDKLQTELKISAMKHEQYEKKNQMLQSNVHDLDEEQQKLKDELNNGDKKHEDDVNNIKNKEYEITSLNHELLKKEENEKDLMQQLDDKDNKIEDLVSDSQHILTLKNEAEEALSEKDSQINNLKRELEQLKKLFELREKQSAGPNGVSPIGPKSLKFPEPDKKVKEPNLDTVNQIQQPDSKVNLADQVKSGVIINEEKDPSNNVIPNPPLADLAPPPQELPANGVLEKPKSNPSGELPIQEIGNPVLPEPQLGNLMQQEGQKQVLQEPNLKQMMESPVLVAPRNPHENMDTAIDDEAKVVEDPLDDQDEEGKEIKHDLEGIDGGVDNYDNYDDEKVDNSHLNKVDPVHGLRNDPNGIGALDLPHFNKVDPVDGLRNDQHGIGALEIPHHGDRGGGEENRDEVNLDDDADHHANERLIDGNLDKKIRNLRL